ncbi:hypothetical protein AGLY_001566 [Aphis glycines]|uniref:Uncharacterized protein n=1 Tax=Aphis glycines TaxID=307491 RepID=A0A6G0U609_APHGL|nr:hypothetical protein AGLY_001566 [Aphis glycines]
MCINCWCIFDLLKSLVHHEIFIRNIITPTPVPIVITLSWKLKDLIPQGFFLWYVEFLNQVIVYMNDIQQHINYYHFSLPCKHCPDKMIIFLKTSSYMLLWPIMFWRGMLTLLHFVPKTICLLLSHCEQKTLFIVFNGIDCSLNKSCQTKSSGLSDFLFRSILVIRICKLRSSSRDWYAQGGREPKTGTRLLRLKILIRPKSFKTENVKYNMRNYIYINKISYFKRIKLRIIK